MQKKTAQLTAHRAGARLGPENSLTTLRRSTALAIPWAEIDVQLTADGVVVVAHDEDLTRLAGIDKRISDLSLEELRQIRTSAHEPIATLEECIAVVRGRTRLAIEMKDYGRSAELPARIIAVLREKDFISGARLSSFSADLVRAARALEPRLSVGYIYDTPGELPAAEEATFISVAHGQVNAALVRKAHNLGLELHAWTVNDGAEMLHLLALGVDNLITDDPVLGKESLAKFERKGWFARTALRLR